MKQLRTAQMSDCVCIEASSIALRDLDALGNEDDHVQESEIASKTLGFVDRFLTLWILLAMIVGILIGYFSPSTADTISSWSTDGVNWPIAIGLIVMMFPPLARVNYNRVFEIMSQSHSQSATEPNSKFKSLLGFSLVLNWFVGPFFMFFLALLCLPDHIRYIRGLIMVGLARCIAMVIVWSDLASGNLEYTAILVCLNSAFQIVCYSPYAYFFLSVFLPLFPLPGMTETHANVSFALIAKSVAIYLGIPFAIGFSCWFLFNQLLGTAEWKQWFKEVFVKYTAPLTLIALLFTIIVMFILKGHLVVSIPVQVLRVATPLCIYFTVMFVGVYYCCYLFQFTLEETITLSFTSASNNFELAIAVSIAVFGLNSPEAFVGVIGPLVEVPVMLGFVHLVKVLHQWYPTESITSKPHGMRGDAAAMSE